MWTTVSSGTFPKWFLTLPMCWMQGIKDMKKEIQARTPFSFKMGVCLYDSGGIESKNFFCSIN